jgi:hypothetical protein
MSQPTAAESNAQRAARTYQLADALLRSEAWTDYMEPRIASEIKRLEREILDPGKDTSPDEIATLRERRGLLKEIAAWPVSDRSAARRQQEEARAN